jgi:LmbE family N-acetylglucosaminyl deacetylase
VTAVRKRRWLIVLLAVVVAIAAAAAGGVWYLTRPHGAGGHAGAAASITDPAAAKAAGDELLAMRGGTVLVVVAHPDDLEWYAGGTAISLAKNNRVVLVMSTAGDKGAGGWPGVADVRERLQLETALIAGYSEVVFLRHPDQGLGQTAAYPGEVEAAFEKYKPSVVLTFDAADEAQGYRHVDHEAAGRVTMTVAKEFGGVTLYLLSSSAPDVIVDYGPVAPTKSRALAIVGDYRVANPLYAWFVAPIQGLNRGEGQRSFGMQAGVPALGVTYAELFRRVVVQ